MTAYTRPPAGAAGASWQGATPYIRPPGGAADATWQPSSFALSGAGIIATTGVGAASHGVVAVGAGIVAVSASGAVEHTSTAVVADGQGAIAIGSTGAVSHGVASSGSGVIGIAVVGGAAHGVAISGIGVIGIAATGSATHERYELRGEVREGGILVNRRVRAYLRSSGELLGQADTISGKFRVPAGFAAAECYVTPIDMDTGATDWLPPTSNRITSVLAQDAV